LSDNSHNEAVYKGLHGTFLFVRNLTPGTVDGFDQTFKPATLDGGFSELNIPAGFVPLYRQHRQQSVCDLRQEECAEERYLDRWVWSIVFGAFRNFDAGTLYCCTTGPDQQHNGLFGKIVAKPRTESVMNMH
jgi:hypothetical protein